MTNQEINQTIARICGWKSETCGPVWYETETKAPDYCNDLNAMHEAEKILSAEQRCLYFWLLLERTSYNGPVIDALDGDNGGFELINMSAAQRAEAFLRVFNKHKQ